MMDTIKFLSKNYRELKKQTRELQGEIAPAVKQVRYNEKEGAIIHMCVSVC